MAVTAHTSALAGSIANNNWAFEQREYGPFAAAAAGNQAAIGTDGNFCLGVMPFAGDIEKISIRVGTLAAADPDTIQFKVAASGVAVASATAITAAEPLTTNANAALAADTFVDVPFSGTAHKNLAEGTAIWLTSAGTIVTMANLMIHITYRRGGYTTNDAGLKVYTGYGNPPNP